MIKTAIFHFSAAFYRSVYINELIETDFGRLAF